MSLSPAGGAAASRVPWISGRPRRSLATPRALDTPRGGPLLPRSTSRPRGPGTQPCLPTSVPPPLPGAGAGRVKSNSRRRVLGAGPPRAPPIGRGAGSSLIGCGSRQRPSGAPHWRRAPGTGVWRPGLRRLPQVKVLPGSGGRLGTSSRVGVPTLAPRSSARSCPGDAAGSSPESFFSGLFSFPCFPRFPPPYPAFTSPLLPRPRGACRP